METQTKQDIFTGIEMGIGTWAWGDRLVWGFGDGYSEKEVKEAYLESIAGGIRFFDTAEVYGQGRSESILGDLIAQTGDEVIVATKMMPYPWRFFKNSLKNALVNSLKRLQLKKVALYQMHQPMPPVSITTWMNQMADLYHGGLIQAIGVSNYNLPQTIEAHEALQKHGLRLASNQVEFHLLNRSIEDNGLFNYCQEQGIKVIAYSPLAMGVLTGKYNTENPLRGTRAVRFNRDYLQQLQPLVAVMSRIGNEKGGKTTAQVALNWVIQKGALPIPGAKDASQAAQNVGALGWRLDSEEVELLEEMSRELQKTGWF